MVSGKSDENFGGVVEDVFCARVWVASAPLHRAGKTTKSEDMLNTKFGNGQLPPVRQSHCQT